MNRLTHVTSVALVLLLASAVVAGVRTKFDTDYDFDSYRTYAWKKGAPALDERVQAAIVKSINRELEARGLSETTGEADLYVSIYAFGEGQATTNVDMGFYTGLDHWGVPTSDTRVNTKGTLLVRLVDAETDKPVWEGFASKTLGENASKAIKKVDKIIQKMFVEFPPG